MAAETFIILGLALILIGLVAGGWFWHVRRLRRAHETAATFQALFADHPDAQLVIDAASRVVAINATAEQLLGWRGCDLTGAPLENYFGIEAQRADYVQSGNSLIRLTRPFGPTLELNLACRRIDGPEGRRYLLRLLPAANLARPEPLPLDFLACVSQELRSPIMSMIGFASMLQRDQSADLSALQVESIDHIHRNSGQMLSLANDLLDMVRLERGEVPLNLRPTLLPDILEQVTGLMREVAGQQQIHILLSPRARTRLWVHTDADRLRQLLVNLLGNAIRHNAPGGTIQIDAELDGDNVRIAIRDDAADVAREASVNAFQIGAASLPGPVIEGVGVGVVIARKLLELLQGTGGARLDPAGGSVFWIALPNAAIDDESLHQAVV